MSRLRRAARRVWGAVFVSHPYDYLVRLRWLRALVRWLPSRWVRDMERGVFTGRGGMLGALVRAELERGYYASAPDVQQGRTRELWGGEAGRAWHAQKLAHYSDRERFEREFLSHRRWLIAATENLLARDGRFHTVCEIGTGNGMFLAYLQQRLPAIRRFVGLDLNPEQIDENRRRYEDLPLEFEAADAVGWIEQAGSGTVFVACGTLECLPGSELRRLLGRMASRCDPGAIGLVEPVNIDLDGPVDSEPRGALTFSHSYPRILAACGFQVLAFHRQPIDSRIAFYDSVTLLATCGMDAEVQAP